MARDDLDIEAFLSTVGAGRASSSLNLKDSIEPEVSKPERVLDLLTELTSEHGGSGLDAQLDVGELIGRGGMGQVHLATQRSMDRKVAVKTVRPDRRDQAAKAGLVREAWITGSLEHPNIVPVHNVGVSASGDPLVILKRIEGVEWSDLLREEESVAERFGVTDLLEWNLSILLQVANAVRFAHSRGVIHRDLKPQNVMIGGFGEVYVVDWGIAVSTGQRRDARLPLPSASSLPAGTPGYMAPEMLAGGAITAHTDVYLLGAILFEVVEGRFPHQAASYAAVAESIKASPPPMNGDWPTELREICRRAMACDPAARYGDVAAFQSAIREFLEHRTSSRLTTGALERLERLEQCARELGQPKERAADDLARLHSLFSECRFGFREAQTSWPENPVAEAGLDRALRVMIELELDNDEPRSARNLATQLATSDPALLERIDAALAYKKARLQKLDALDKQHDVQIGWRTRTLTLGIIGLIWSVGTLGLALLGGPDLVRSPSRMAIMSVLMFAVIASVGYWARESLMKTVINRRLFMTALFVPPAQLILVGGSVLLELSLAQLMSSMLFLWFALAGMVALTTTSKFLPMVIGYLAGFLVSTQLPDHVLVVMGIANTVMLVNVGYCSIRARTPEFEL